MESDEPLRDQSMLFAGDEESAYQAISLPGEVVTPGHDRSYLLDEVFGDSFAGKSYLDVGSHHGYFCLEALRRGASRSCGIETHTSTVRRARKIADVLALTPHYIEDDFENWEPEGEQFDVVSCLNVLHHMTDPIHAIRKMMRIAREKIVLEVAKPTWKEVLHDGINPLRLYDLGSPAIFLGRPEKRGYGARRTYMFTPAALKVIFNIHSNSFEPISIKPSPFKGRLIVEAKKKRIGDLVVVAGPTSCGKSTLCEKLIDDGDLQQQFGMRRATWQLIGARSVPELGRGRLENLILHYDFLRPWRTSIHSYARDPALELLNLAERVSIVTIVAGRSRLREQLRRKEIEPHHGRGGASDSHMKLLELYDRPQFLNDWYAAWDAFVSTVPAATRLMVENRGEFTCPAPIDWPEILERKD